MSSLAQTTSYGGGGGNRTRFSFTIKTVDPLNFISSSSSPPPTIPLPLPHNELQSIRIDQRRPDQFRKLFLKTSLINQSSGSAYIELGNTKVICSIHGPRPIRAEQSNLSGESLTLGQGSNLHISSSCLLAVGIGGVKTTIDEYSDKAVLLCHFKYTPFRSSKRNPLHGSIEQLEQEMSIELIKIMELVIIREQYPKASIEINILVIEDDGSALTAAINCASIALCKAGILMYDLIVASNVSKSPENIISIDPCSEEESKQLGSIYMAYMPASKKMPYLRQIGELSSQDSLDAIQLALNGCVQLQETMKQTLVERKSDL